MRVISTTSAFDKDYKKVKKQPKFDENRFTEIVSKIQNGEELDARCKDHKMNASGSKFEGFRNCHIFPDTILIYSRDDTEVKLIRIGSHNNLGLTN